MPEHGQTCMFLLVSCIFLQHNLCTLCGSHSGGCVAPTEFDVETLGELTFLATTSGETEELNILEG